MRPQRREFFSVLAVVAGLAATTCGGRTGEQLFDPSADASADAPTTGSAGGSSGVSGAGGSKGVGTTSTGTTGAGGSITGAGGSSGDTCNAGNCDGCCDAQGRCRSGLDLNACGLRAARCLDCGAIGFACTTSGACEGIAPPCGPSNCTGCCSATGLCRYGTESDACGSGGNACDNCAAKAAGCSAGVCQGKPPKCGPDNCGGCCDANGSCQIGTSDAICGAQGAACRNCSTQSQTCTQPGSYCAAPLPCATVCPAGCCDARGVCHAPTDTACGTQGQTCSDCTLQGRVCAPQGYCYTGQSCGSGNCAGCCTATGQCQNGADNSACGQFGSLCDNCSAKNVSCRNQVCSDGATCPGAFAGCNPNAITDPPKTSTSCSQKELATVVTACTGAAAGCGAAFNQLLASNPACAGCLAQFVGDQAFARCLAPFLSQACNHYLTCDLSCSIAVCGQCPAADTNNCQNAAGQAGGACGAYAYGVACALAALQGPGAFCNWDMYKDAGLWLDAVGGRYCR